MESEVKKVIHSNSKLLSIIRCFGVADRTILMKCMDLSWPTIQKSIEQLKLHGILTLKTREVKDNKGGDNTKSKEEFSICPKSGYYFGISVGGSQIKVSIIDMEFNPVSSKEFKKYFVDKNHFFSPMSGSKDWIEDSSSDYGYFYRNTPISFPEIQTTINLIIEEIIKLDDNPSLNICGIGIAFTGAVDNKSKKIIKTFSLKCFDNLPIKYDSLIYPDNISYCISHNINISFDNIAKAATISEKFHLYNMNNPNNRYKNCKNIACIYLGTGVGSGLILDNRLYRGASNFSELGHIDVLDPGWISDITIPNGLDNACSCGGINCLEYKIRKNVFRKPIETFRTLTSQGLAEEFEGEDTSKTQVEKRLKLLAFYLGQTIKTLTNILNLDLIIITGKFNCFRNKLEGYLYDEKTKNYISYTNSDCSFAYSEYGALAPSLGAAILSSFEDSDEEIIWY